MSQQAVAMPARIRKKPNKWRAEARGRMESLFIPIPQLAAERTNYKIRHGCDCDSRSGVECEKNRCGMRLTDDSAVTYAIPRAQSFAPNVAGRARRGLHGADSDSDRGDPAHSRGTRCHRDRADGHGK